LIGDKPIVVYGFGDNFFRSRSAFGPLDGLKIVCIIDKQHETLSRSNYSNKFSFLSITLTLEKYKDYVTVITVSWDGQRIEDNLRDLGFNQIYQI
jgi:hypothetical protein